MIADCETCERKNVPCSSCEESQRAICFLCQGDISDPYCELEDSSVNALLNRRAIDPVTAILTVLFALIVAPYAALLLGLVWPIGDVLP